jgi:uncharacterized delta-60 repeat protein
MDKKATQQSVARVVQANAAGLKKAAPVTLAVALVSASLLPVVQQAGSPELIMGMGILSGMGTEFLKSVGKDVIARLGKKKDEEIRKELEKQLLEHWNATGKKGADFRRELSEFLKRNGIIQMALDAAPPDARESMAQSLASLANQFEEFGWVLDEIKETLAEIQKRQVEQLTTQREQLDLQREQLAKTNLLLKMQRERKAKPAPAAPGPEAEDLPPADIPCPYKGLASFQPEDAEYFFGREELTAQLLARLAGTTFLGVIGPSGSGKSSLVRAGVVPALWNGEIPGSAEWKVLILRPGPSPLEEIAVRVALQSGISAASLRTDLRRDVDALRLAIQQYLVSQPEDAKFVLVVDQFEELFTQCENESERDQFIAALVNAAQSAAGRMMVILTLRADFYGHCAAYPDLAGLLSANQVLVGAMSRDELRRAITLPAKQAGLALESGLVELVLQDAQGEAGALPMVSHALMETWKRRSGHWLKVDAYQAFGGVRQAITSTAEEVYLAFNESERGQVRDIFLRLTRLDADAGGDGWDARCRATLSDLLPAGADPAQTERILDRLADARLVVKDLGRDSEPEVEVAHEALIRHWERLRAWLDEDREALRLREGISDDARRWEATERDESLLNHRGGRLEDALRLAENPAYALSERERAYLAACAELRNRQKRERERRVRWTVGASLAAAVIFLLLAGFGLVQRNEATMRANEAATAQANAEEQAQLAITAQTKAEEQATIARARELASQSQVLSLDDQNLMRLVGLLAVESAQQGAKLQADQALRRYLALAALPVTRMEHGGDVWSIDFSPDGNYVVSGSHDKTVRIWETTTGREVARMNHDDRVTSVAFSPDGLYVVSGSEDKTARVWDADTGLEVSRMNFDNRVASVTFRSDGRFVLSGSNDGTARVWEVETGREVARISHDDDVMSVAFSPDGRYVVSGSLDNSARVWESTTGREVTRMSHDGSIYAVAFSPDGQYVVSGSGDNTARVWEFPSGREVARTTHNFAVRAVAFSPDGRYVVSGSDDGKAQVWEAETGREIARIKHLGEIWSVAFSPDGRYVVSGGGDGKARVWESDTGRDVTRMDHGERVLFIAFSPDGRYVASSNLDGLVLIWKSVSRNVFAIMSHDNTIRSIAFSPDGRHVVSGSDDGKAQVWEAMTGRELARLNHDGSVESVAFSLDGRYVVSGSRDNTARVWETATGREITRMEHDGWVKSVAFSPDGKYVVSGSSDGTARVWEASTGVEVAHMTHDDRVYAVAFSPDGKYVVSGSDDNTARVWEAATGREVARMTHDWAVESVAFSPDERYVVSGSSDGTVRVWEAKTGREIGKMSHDQSLANNIVSVAFSSDGRYVLSGSWDKTIRVWNVDTGQETARMNSDDSVYSVAFSPNGHYVLSGGRNGKARFWRWQLNDLIDEACRRLPRNFTRAEWAQYFPDEPYRATCPNLPLEPEPQSP